MLLKRKEKCGRNDKKNKSMLPILLPIVMSDLLPTSLDRNHNKNFLVNWWLLMWDMNCSGWLGQWKIKARTLLAKMIKECQWENHLLWYDNIEFPWNNILFVLSERFLFIYLDVHMILRVIAHKTNQVLL